MRNMDYFEHEELVGVKAIVFHNGYDNYHLQIVDGTEIFFNQAGLTGEDVVKYAKAYGFEVSNPNCRQPLVEYQWHGTRG